MIFDPAAYLIETGERDDRAIDLIMTSLAFSAMTHPGLSIERYKFHGQKLSGDVRQRFNDLLEGGAEDDVHTRLAALKHVIADQEGYRGDEETYDDLQNADLVRVIERRMGLPIALAILYIQTGRNNDFILDGLNFPGHFLCRIEYAGVRVIFDPFMRCQVMEAPDLRQLVKRIKGHNAELSADYYTPASNREILIRLLNNIKLRLIEAEDYKSALHAVEMMRLIDPKEFRLLFDAGILFAKTGQKKAAIEVLEEYLTYATDWRDREDAESVLRQLQIQKD